MLRKIFIHAMGWWCAAMVRRKPVQPAEVSGFEYGWKQGYSVGYEHGQRDARCDPQGDPAAQEFLDRLCEDVPA